MTHQSPNFLERIALVLTAAGFTALPFVAHAQLGATNLDGMRIDARMIHRFGDTRDLDCSISLEFTGSKVTNAAGMSPVTVIQAIDDTGRSLVRTTQPIGSVATLPPSRSIHGYWQQVTGLRSPDSNATAIRLLECETELKPQATNTARQVLRFKLENIHLPWIDPPNLEVVATDVSRLDTPVIPSACRLLLTFFGGPITNCAGIQALRIQKTESDGGQQLRLKESERSSLDRFSPLECGSGCGRNVQKWVTFDSPSPATRQIRVVEGEAELFFPSLTNGALNEFGEFIAHPGEPLRKAALDQGGVKLTFLGRDNFETKKAEWRLNRATITTVVPETKLPTDVKDSLLFSLDDPDHRVVKFEFTDENGHELRELTRTISTATLDPRANQLRLYTFRTPPPESTKLKLTLITPESLRRVPFKVENIALP